MLIELTELDGGIVLINADNICEITRPRPTLDQTNAHSVVIMVNGSRHQVKEGMVEIRSKLK